MGLGYISIHFSVLRSNGLQRGNVRSLIFRGHSSQTHQPWKFRSLGILAPVLHIGNSAVWHTSSVEQHFWRKRQSHTKEEAQRAEDIGGNGGG